MLVIDRVTHLWEAARAAYNGKLMPNGGISIQLRPRQALVRTLEALGDPTRCRDAQEHQGTMC